MAILWDYQPHFTAGEAQVDQPGINPAVVRDEADDALPFPPQRSCPCPSKASCRRDNEAIVVYFPPLPGFFPSSHSSWQPFPARGHSLAEHLSEQGVGTPLRRSEHMQISQRDAQPEVLMNL